MDGSRNLTGDCFGNAFGGPRATGRSSSLIKGSGTITALASFDGTRRGGPLWRTLVMDGAGNLYGTTRSAEIRTMVRF